MKHRVNHIRRLYNRTYGVSLDLKNNSICRIIRLCDAERDSVTGLTDWEGTVLDFCDTLNPNRFIVDPVLRIRVKFKRKYGRELLLDDRSITDVLRVQGDSQENERDVERAVLKILHGINPNVNQ